MQNPNFTMGKRQIDNNDSSSSSSSESDSDVDEKEAHKGASRGAPVAAGASVVNSLWQQLNSNNKNPRSAN